MSVLESLLFPKVRIKPKSIKALKGKTILITGASYGIGEALAYYLAQAGCRLILWARTEEKLYKVQKKCLELGAEECHFQIVDLYQIDQVKTAIQDLKKKFKSLDCFVSNAGKSIKRSFKESKDRWQDIERTNSLNFQTPIYIIQQLYDLMLKFGGQIINVSSLSVLMPATPYWAAYESSKKAFDAWCQSNEYEWKLEGVILKSLYFPLVKTRMSSVNKDYDKSPKMSVDQAALRIVRLMITNKKVERSWWSYGLFMLKPFRKIWARSIYKSYQK